MGVRRPSISQTLAGVVLAFALTTTGCSSNSGNTGSANPPTASPTASAPMQAPRSIPEDPQATVKGADLKGVAGDCALTEFLPIKAQGVQSNYVCGENILLAVSEIRGQEATEAWKYLLTNPGYVKASQIAPNARTAQGRAVIVYKSAGDDSIWIGLEARTRPGTPEVAKPLDNDELTKLGKLIAKRIKASA